MWGYGFNDMESSVVCVKPTILQQPIHSVLGPLHYRLWCQLKLLNKGRRSPKLLGNKYLQVQAHCHACKDQTFEQQVVGMFQTTSPIVKVGRICPQWLFQPAASQCMHNFLLFHDRPKSAGNVLLPHMLGKLVRVLTWCAGSSGTFNCIQQGTMKSEHFYTCALIYSSMVH